MPPTIPATATTPTTTPAAIPAVLDDDFFAVDVSDSCALLVCVTMTTLPTKVVSREATSR